MLLNQSVCWCQRLPLRHLICLLMTYSSHLMVIVWPLWTSVLILVMWYLPGSTISLISRVGEILFAVKSIMCCATFLSVTSWSNRSYCSDSYGCVLWDLSHPCTEDVCINAWQKGLRCALGVPWRTHLVLLAHVTDSLPLRDELLCRTAMFV